MSESLYNIGGLRFWNEDEIELRELFSTRVISSVKRTLLNQNASWSFSEMEGPILTPENAISNAYGDKDIFTTNHITDISKQGALCLRPETTNSSYLYAKHLKKKLPLCVYQKGKSFRRELNDGATASKLRFNEFWQLEFQCIYSDTTKADYRDDLIKMVSLEIARFTGLEIRVIESDRLPEYSQSTLDIEVNHSGSWREMASCSIRTDYADNCRVCEIAIGLDRVATLAARYEVK